LPTMATRQTPSAAYFGALCLPDHLQLTANGDVASVGIARDDLQCGLGCRADLRCLGTLFVLLAEQLRRVR
jgi:hypothetical protein